MEILDPTDRRPLHFMGIGGAGMSALALLARRRGVPVTGCDTDASGAADVAAAGAEVTQGHDPKHVDGARAVVVTAAVRPDHPELERARALGVPVIARKVALAALIRGTPTVAIAGTHGKTTTTVMTTEALEAAGLAPTGLAGGRASRWGGNARSGSDRLFVVEADEYDKAFLELEPTIAVINNVEADHLECYGTLAQLEDAFVEFASRARVAFIGADDAGARRVAARLGRKAKSFGLTPGSSVAVSDVEQAADATRAHVRLPRGGTVDLQLRVPGLHNLRNAAAALAVVDELQGDLPAALRALADFSGVGRRFERIGVARGVDVVDDYAHHPTELVATLGAARQAFPSRRLVAIFQPHLYSRTQQHAEAMGVALAAADVAVVTEIYGAREQPIPGVSGKQVADAASAAGAPTIFVAERERISRRVFEELRDGDVVLTLGAGDITRVGPELLRLLSA